ncbi:DUF1330 domain-containing protein [Roseomonas rosulenta]|uniref:DUF1330 domain-containing protein n=1 Tax=Roseomonas rosulenta TaxID=2748667 RepID=UPI0018DFDF8E|nr:DUF1330 domain-containing protein [Roseomonas rosulenta]
MPAYAIFDVVEITDPAAMQRYRAAVPAIVARHGGRYLAIGGPVRALEGSRPAPSFPVIIEFPDLAAAQAWHASEDYRDLLALRQAAAHCEAVLVDGLAAA